MNEILQVDLNTVGTVTAILAALVGWALVWRKANIVEGRHLEEVKSMKERMLDVEKRTEFIRGCTEEASAEMKALKTDMEWVKLALDEIRQILRSKP